MPTVQSKEAPEVLGKNAKELFFHFARTTTSTKWGKLLLVLWGSGGALSLAAGIYKNLQKPESKSTKVTQKKKRPSVDLKTQLAPILRIAFPSLASKSTAYLLLYTVALLVRVFLTIKIARITGKLGKMVGARTFTRMFHMQVIFGLWCMPAAFVNALMSYANSKLALAMRHNLVQHIHNSYFADLVFYRASNVGANRMEDIDQRAGQDLKRFTSQLAELYGNLLKPLLEVIIVSQTLASLMGGRQLLAFFGYFVIAGQWLRFVMPNFAALTAQHSQLEGEFRGNHSRVISHAEEIAFYGGGEREKQILEQSFGRVERLSNFEYFLQFLMGIVDSNMVKYGSTMMAYSMLIPAVYLGSHGLKGKSTQSIMEYYLTSTQLFVSLGTACKHLVLSYKRIHAVGGLAARVGELLQMLQRRLNWQEEKLMQEKAMSTPGRLGGPPKMKEGEIITFDKVDIFSPTGEILAKGVTFSVPKGRNVLVTGPNGCGKSSLFRILGGLWPLCSGEITRPPLRDLFYIPQRPYMVPGTLRDQVTYPVRLTDKSQDDKLFKLMELVQLEHLIEREGGWDSEREWLDVLSGGEKQRVAMARLYYHRPAFGILDECTSAVSVDVEGKMYDTCRELGITLFSVSHRPQLRRFHDYLLSFDGEGNWAFTPLPKEETQ